MTTLVEALTAFAKRKRSRMLFGVKIRDANLKGNFILVESDVRFFSAPAAAVVDEVQEGAFTRLWLEEGAPVWTSTLEVVPVQGAGLMSQFFAADEVAAVLTEHPRWVPPHQYATGPARCMFLSLCDAANAQLTPNSSLIAVVGQHSQVAPAKASLKVCLSCRPGMGSPDEWIGDKDPSLYTTVGQLIDEFSK